MIDVLHVVAMALAAFRLTELVAMDRISEPFRRRFPHYLWGCPRCVSVWAGVVCTAAFVVFPWANWPLAIAYLYLVQWDWKAKAWGQLQERVHTEIQRRVLQAHDDARRAKETADSELQRRGFVMPRSNR